MISQIHLSASTQPASTQVAEVLKMEKEISFRTFQDFAYFSGKPISMNTFQWLLPFK